MIAHLQPYIHARCFPVVRFVENIKQAITVEVREPGFVKPDTTGKGRLPEMAVAIPVEDPGFRLGIVWIKPALSPFGHLGSEDVEIAIAVDVGNLEAVTVDYVPAHQVMAYPRLGMLRFTFAFVPFQRRDLIPGVDNQIDVRPNRVGRYVGHCAEFCGLAHDRMGFDVETLTPGAFDRWARETRGRAA